MRIPRFWEILLTSGCSPQVAVFSAPSGLAVCLHGGFRQVLLRGDTDLSQTQHLDRWHADGRVRFLFGYDARPNVVALAVQ